MKNHKTKNWWKDFKKEPNLNCNFSIIWLVVISCVAFLWYLGSIGLVDKTEPMFVEAARQMTVTVDWITPYWNGETRFDKPPLVYWLMAIAFKIIGVNEWAARLPSALFAIALTALGFYTLRYFGFPRPATAVEEQIDRPIQRERQLWISAWIGAAIIALNPAWIAWGRTGVSDMLLASTIGMALLTFFIGYALGGRENVRYSFLLPSSVWYIGFYVFIALAILAKGPVGAVLPALIIGAFLLYVGKFREVLQEMRLVRGILITSAIAIPWFVLVTLANGKAYIDTFFGYHNLQRFTSVVSSHRGPWYFYIPVILVSLAPWSIYLPIAIAHLRFWERDKWKQSPRSTHLGLFALFWFICVFGFFSISVTKLPSYVLPLMPAGAIMVTLFWSDQMKGTLPPAPPRGTVRGELRGSKKNTGLFISAIFNILFLIILAVGTFLSPKLMGYDPAMPQVRQILQQSGLPILSGIVWGTAAIASIFLLWRQRRWLWSANLAGFMAFMIFVAPPAALLIDEQRQLPLRQLSALVTQVEKPGEELIAIGFIRPSVVFYTQRTVNYIQTFKEAFVYIKETAVTVPNPPTVLILSNSQDLDPKVLKRHQYQELGSAGAFKLLRVSKRY
ncbi:ArnT family glycosyltransferase [Argonema antarcticum]|uniref:ArnT family glycosyltransferase n=1 Tax=Argonema antarcticum TaxID=2942763 RepID=UPI00201170BD|nr:glycosyltransferase family 39 protein [Argonema antarcticum]MCL1473114.1 glycosyltransferase family 39 protein [Argonema antarcticum A004/B2]